MQFTYYSAVQYDDLGVALFPRMSADLRAAFSWGPDAGNMAFNHGDPEDVRKRLNSFLKRAGMPRLEHCLTMIAENKARCIDVDAEYLQNNPPSERGRFLEADAIFTTESIPIVVKPADCTVSILFAKAKGVLGIVHAGFRGADLGIAALAVNHMKQRYSVDAEQLTIAISPSIAHDSYYVQTKGELAFPEKWAPFISESGGKLYLDTLGHIVRQFADCGVPASQMEAFAVDTYRSAAMGHAFSERYSRLHPAFTNGRMIVAAQLVK